MVAQPPNVLGVDLDKADLLVFMLLTISLHPGEIGSFLREFPQQVFEKVSNTGQVAFVYRVSKALFTLELLIQQFL